MNTRATDDVIPSPCRFITTAPSREPKCKAKGQWEVVDQEGVITVSSKLPDSFAEEWADMMGKDMLQ